MPDPVAIGAEVVELLEQGDAAAVSARLAPRVRGWAVDAFLHGRWAPGLDELAGSPRSIVERRPAGPSGARFVVEGPQGRAVVTVQVDDRGLLSGLALEAAAHQGIANVVVACPPERRDEATAFYEVLLGRDRWRRPRLVFDEADERYVPPRWPDPDRPAQVHLDLLTLDLDASTTAAIDAGARLLRDAGSHRVVEDPLGHPFCLCPGPDEPTDRSDAPARLGRIVLDCPDPERLARFYAPLLDMPVRTWESPGGIVIAAEDRRLPMLGFQRVEPYRPPRWPDPDHPAQLHLDLAFDDRDDRAREVERRGGARLPAQGGSCPVYADPAGHPFCLCLPGE